MGDADWLDSSLPPVAEIRRRLEQIVPEQLDARGWIRRELAAKVVFVMLYGYAVEGLGRWLRPTAVTDMTDDQARAQSPVERREWLDLVQSPRRPVTVSGRWFSENTREPIRDETLRELKKLGMVVERAGLTTTSPKPRYALARGFGDLFNPALRGEALDEAIDRWREVSLDRGALARIALAGRRATKPEDGDSPVIVRLPSGETRRLAPGPSSELIKAAVEELAARFLVSPAVVLISESAHKVSHRDDELLRAIGLEVDVRSTLPDLVLADTGAEPLLLVFVECVVSDGPVDARRRDDLLELAVASGLAASDCAFVTVFRDRA